MLVREQLQYLVVAFMHRSLLHGFCHSLISSRFYNEVFNTWNWTHFLLGCLWESMHPCVIHYHIRSLLTQYFINYLSYGKSTFYSQSRRSVACELHLALRLILSGLPQLLELVQRTTHRQHFMLFTNIIRMCLLQRDMPLQQRRASWPVWKCHTPIGHGEDMYC